MSQNLGNRRGPWLRGLDTVATVLVILVAGTILWKQWISPNSASGAGNARPPRPVAPLPAEPVSLVGAHLLGPDTAVVGVLEFTDFQCPFCAQFATGTLAELKKRYVDSGTVRFALKHAPIESIHPVAFKSAVAANCAGQQGRFWEMHDSLFRGYKTLGSDSFRPMAAALRLDLDSFEKCLQADDGVVVRSDMQAARDLGVDGTPTVFVGRLREGNVLDVTHRFPGAVPIAELERVIEPMLKR